VTCYSALCFRLAITFSHFPPTLPPFQITASRLVVPNHKKSSQTLASPLHTMDNVRLNPRIAGTRERQIQDAKNMQKIVEDRLTKKGLTPPSYEFLELIGKGAYGRVYKR
jgi:hypothetical protein